MRKWLALVVLLLAGLLGYVAAGPYITVHAIRTAIQRQDANTLARNIDFPALRASIKAQLMDQLVRAAGVDAQSSVLGALGANVAGGMVDGAVETLVNPYGLAALIEGQKTWDRLGDRFSNPNMIDPPQAPREKPWKDADHHYESLSRFTVTVKDGENRPVVFVLTRAGLRWKLSDIRIPLRQDRGL